MKSLLNIALGLLALACALIFLSVLLVIDAVWQVLVVLLTTLGAP